MTERFVTNITHDVLEGDEILRHGSLDVCTCIGCGCTDDAACFDETTEQPCHWLRLAPEERKGLCSCCRGLESAWDEGDREIRVPVEMESEDEGIPFVEDALSEKDAESSIDDEHESPAESLGMVPQGNEKGAS